MRRPVEDIFFQGFSNAPVSWLQEARSYTFLADPFGMWREGKLAVFVEAYDYRSRLGHIEGVVFDEKLHLLHRRPCLREQWHLSYPFVFEDGSDTWMLPEAHRSGALTLYRNVNFPFEWRAECRLDLPELGVDATPMFHEGLWWLFYSVADGCAVPRLHAAYAKSLRGTWKLHPMNPLVTGTKGARPGGTPILTHDGIMLPVQDSTRGYGSGIRLLTLRNLSPGHVELTLGENIRPPGNTAAFNQGFHTLSAAGAITLIDVKRIERSMRRLPVDGLGRLRRAARGRLLQLK